MAAYEGKHIFRIRLSFKDPSAIIPPVGGDNLKQTPQPSWFLVDTSRIKTINELEWEISTRFNLNQTNSNTIVRLTLDNCLIPTWEQSQILRDGDSILVTISDERESNGDKDAHSTCHKEIKVKKSHKKKKKDKHSAVEDAEDILNDCLSLTDWEDKNTPSNKRKKKSKATGMADTDEETDHTETKKRKKDICQPKMNKKHKEEYKHKEEKETVLTFIPETNYIEGKTGATSKSDSEDSEKDVQNMKISINCTPENMADLTQNDKDKGENSVNTEGEIKLELEETKKKRRKRRRKRKGKNENQNVPDDNAVNQSPSENSKSRAETDLFVQKTSVKPRKIKIPGIDHTGRKHVTFQSDTEEEKQPEISMEVEESLECDDSNKSVLLDQQKPNDINERLKMIEKGSDPETLNNSIALNNQRFESVSYRNVAPPLYETQSQTKEWSEGSLTHGIVESTNQDQCFNNNRLSNRGGRKGGRGGRQSQSPANLFSSAKVFDRRRSKKQGFVPLSKEEQLRTNISTNYSVVIVNSGKETEVQLSDPVENEQEDQEGTAEKEEIAQPAIDFSKLPPLVGPPRAGDKIAYKVLEVSADYTPEISDYKIAKVLSCCVEDSSVVLQPEVRSTTIRRNGKFDCVIEDDEECLTNTSDCHANVTIDWRSLLEPRLMTEV